MNVEIRKARPEDAAIMALLARVTFREAFSHFWSDEEVLKNYLNTTFSVEKLQNSLCKPNNVFWLAFVDKMPVGYAKLKKYCPYETLIDPNPAQLQKIYVLNDYIGKKIGQKLQDEVFNEVEKEKIKTLWLAVWDENAKAIKFYERHGFRKETKYHYSFDSLEADYEVMTKTF